MLTNPMMLGVLLSGLWVVLALPAGVCLILCYQKSRMSGFLWLFGGVIAWPLVARGLTMAVNMAAPAIMAARGLPASSYMNSFMLLSLAETAIGGVLLLAGCFILYRQIVERGFPVAQ